MPSFNKEVILDYIRSQLLDIESENGSITAANTASFTTKDGTRFEIPRIRPVRQSKKEPSLIHVELPPVRLKQQATLGLNVINCAHTVIDWSLSTKTGTCRSCGRNVTKEEAAGFARENELPVYGTCPQNEWGHRWGHTSTIDGSQTCIYCGVKRRNQP